jgi:hypothetical protein
MNGGFKFEVQLSLPAADTAKRLQLKAQGCRFGYPGNRTVNEQATPINRGRRFYRRVSLRSQPWALGRYSFAA